MRNLSFIFLLIMALTGCSSDIKSTLGLKKSGPDEFSVIANQPLTIPPSFQLTNPSQNHNISKVFVTDQEVEFSNRGEIVETQEDVIFLENLSEKPKHRPDVNDHHYEEKKGFFRKISSRLSGEKKEKVIDPVLEKKRIQENLEKNKPINQGEIHEKDISKSPLQSILEGK